MFYSSQMHAKQDRPYAKALFNAYKIIKMEIISNIFSDHSTIKVKINTKVYCCS